MSLYISYSEEAQHPTKIYLYSNGVPETIKHEDTSDMVEFISPKEYSLHINLKEDLEANRLNGYTAFNKIKTKGAVSIILDTSTDRGISFLEGITLSSYSFDYYKKDKSPRIEFEISGINKNNLDELKNTVNAVFKVKDFVNEPPNKFKSDDFKNSLENLFQNTSIETTVLSEEFFKERNYGGLLAVNAASPTAPYLIVSEHKPQDAKNTQPIVLIGKGVVYDTGGLSLKPTPNSMDIMKCDMAGAATVAGIMKAVHDNALPVHLISILPITDNLIGPEAFAPGDVITMANGKTVEVMNTDAEGRLILADALFHAQQYDPELVLDIATLTGAALRAIGKEGTVFMGNAQQSTKDSLTRSGNTTHERLVEFPLWDEYNEQLKSTTADIKNIGGSEAGAITAGKFLEHFVDYNWLHLDIAGPSFTTSPYNYRGLGATGSGVRLIYDFLKNYSNEQ